MRMRKYQENSSRAAELYSNLIKSSKRNYSVVQKKKKNWKLQSNGSKGRANSNQNDDFFKIDFYQFLENRFGIFSQTCRINAIKNQRKSEIIYCALF